jgi:hypothetical protein
MNQRFESAHVKNLVFFEELVHCCQNLGKNYDPVYDHLTVEKLDLNYTNACSVIDEVNLCLENFIKMIENRQALYLSLTPLALRVTKKMKSSRANSQIMKQAMVLSKKLGSKKVRITSETPVSTEPGNMHIVRLIELMQEKFVSLSNHFINLIYFAKSLPRYQPREADLKVAVLEAKYYELEVANAAVIQAFATLSSARGKRDCVFYAPYTGLVTLANQAKKYIMDNFDTESDVYKQISQLYFRVIRPRILGSADILVIEESDYSEPDN